jgi:hypothetical protein
VSYVPALDERRRRMAASFKRPPADVACEGCQNVTPQCWSNDCKILKYLDGRELIDLDLSEPEGRETYQREYIRDKYCVDYVTAVVKAAYEAIAS